MSGDFISDGAPFETPESEAAQGYATTPASLGSFMAATVGEGPTSWLMRAAERGQYAGASRFDQGLAEAGYGQAAAYGAPLAIPEPTETTMMSPEDYNARYAPRGADGKPVAIGDQPMPEGLARVIGQQKQASLERESIISRYSAAHSWPTNLAVGAVASLADPLNASTLFLPGIGETGIAAALGRAGLGTGIIARTLARAGAGAATGAAIQAPLSALEYGLAPEEARDYDLRDAFRDVAYGAVPLAVMHAGFGGMGDVLRWSRGEGPRAGINLDHLEEAAPIISADAATRDGAMRTAVAQIADGRPVDVRPFFPTPPETATAIGRFIDHPFLPEGVPEDLPGLDIHQVARQIDPETFTALDRETTRAGTFRRWLDELAATRDEPAPPSAIDTEIDRLQQRNDDATPRLRKKYMARLAELQQQRDAAAADLPPRQDTAGMAHVRQQLAETNYRLRDLAPAVTDAYGRARQAMAIAVGARAGEAAGTIAARQADFMRPTIDVRAFADQQHDLWRDGFVPGIAPEELAASPADPETVQGSRPEAAGARNTRRPTGTATAQDAELTPTEEARVVDELQQLVTERTPQGDQQVIASTGQSPSREPDLFDRELAEASRQLAEVREHLTSEDQGEIARADEIERRADERSAAFDEAARCLTERGT